MSKTARSRTPSRAASRAFSVSASPSGGGASVSAGLGASASGAAASGLVPVAAGVPWAIPELKIVGLLYFIVLAVYANAYQGRRWELFVSDGLAVGAAVAVVLLDPTQPKYKQQIFAALLVMTLAFSWNVTVPHFAAASDLIQKLVAAAPKADALYGTCVRMFRKMNDENPLFGIQKIIIEHDNLTTTVTALLKK